MDNTINVDELKRLSSSLAALAARLESKEAAGLCGKAAAILSQALSDTTDTDELGQLASALSVVVPCRWWRLGWK
jgi:hypothetical protein